MSLPHKEQLGQLYALKAGFANSMRLIDLILLLSTQSNEAAADGWQKVVLENGDPLHKQIIATGLFEADVILILTVAILSGNSVGSGFDFAIEYLKATKPLPL